MEWVEFAGKTVEEAKELALDQLGVAEADAEVVVLAEPKSGLFGRTRGEARVRARIRPVGPRPKRERSRDRSRGGREGQARGAPGRLTAGRWPRSLPVRGERRSDGAEVQRAEQQWRLGWQRQRDGHQSLGPTSPWAAAAPAAGENEQGRAGRPVRHRGRGKLTGRRNTTEGDS